MATQQKEKTAYEQLSPKRRRFVDCYFECELTVWKAYVAAGYGGEEPDDQASEAWQKWYSSVRSASARLFANVNIQEAIGERLKQKAMPAEEVLARLADEASASAEDFTSFQTTVIRPRILRPVREILAALEAEIAFEEEYATAAELEGDELEAHEAEMERLRRKVLRYRLRLTHDPDATEEVYGPPVEIEEPYVDLVKAKRRGKLHLVKAIKRDRNGRVSVDLHDAQKAKELIGRHHGLFTDRVEHTGPDGAPLAVNLQIVNRRSGEEGTDG